MINLNEFSTRRQKELIKRHALNQKQFPKNIKVILPYECPRFVFLCSDQTS